MYVNTQQKRGDRGRLLYDVTNKYEQIEFSFVGAKHGNHEDVESHVLPKNAYESNNQDYVYRAPSHDTDGTMELGTFGAR